MSAGIHSTPKLLSAEAQQVPARLQDIVDKALEKNRASRYQTAQEMLADLKDLQRQLESSGEGERRSVSDVEVDAKTIALPSGGTEDASARATIKAEGVTSQRIISRRNAIVVGLLLAVALGAAAFAYWTYNQGSFEAKSIAVLPFRN